MQRCTVHNNGCVYDLLEGSGIINSGDGGYYRFQEAGTVIEKGASAGNEVGPGTKVGPRKKVINKRSICNQMRSI